MNHTTLGTIVAISMVAALAIVGVSMLSSTKVQAISLGDLNVDPNGASIGGRNGLNVDPNGASIGGPDGLDTRDLAPTPEK